MSHFNSNAGYSQKQPSRGVCRKRYSENMQQTYKRTLMSKCDFNKVAKQLYRNHTSAWVFSCKFAAYFQNTLLLRTPLGGCFCTLNNWHTHWYNFKRYLITNNEISKPDIFSRKSSTKSGLLLVKARNNESWIIVI